MQFDENVAIRRFRMFSASRMRESDDTFKKAYAQVSRLNNEVSLFLREEDVGSSSSIENKAEVALALASRNADTLPAMHVLCAQRNMMVVLAGKERHEEAIEVGQRAHDGYRRLLGPLHPSTVSLLRELSVIVLSSGNYAGSEPLLRAALHGCVELFGDVHPDALSARMLLGQLLATRGVLDEAKLLFRLNLASARALYGDEAPLTHVAASNLSALLIERREFWEAEGLLTWHVRVASRASGQSSDEAKEVAMRLAECRRLSGDESFMNAWPESKSEASECSSVFGGCKCSTCVTKASASDATSVASPSPGNRACVACD